MTTDAISDRLLRFAVDRAVETHSLRRHLETSAYPSPMDPRTASALSAAKAWEDALLWVAWRLSGRRLPPG